MLPLRTAIFAAIAAVSLWALFSLLENLREPGLLRSEKAVVVKGCDSRDSQNLDPACFQLFCQKTLLDLKHVPLNAKFEPRAERRSGSRRLVVGRAVSGQGVHDFACVMQGIRVIDARTIEPEEVEDLLDAEPDDWSL